MRAKPWALHHALVVVYSLATVSQQLLVVVNRSFDHLGRASSAAASVDIPGELTWKAKAKVSCALAWHCPLDPQ